MSNKYVIYGAIILSFALGRYLTPTKVETKTVEVEKKRVDTDKDLHKETTKTEVVKPDGSKETITKITEDTSIIRTSKSTSNSTTESTVQYSGSHTTLLGLASYAPEHSGVVYGGAISRNLLGPIVGHGFLLTNGTFGVGLGVEF